MADEKTTCTVCQIPMIDLPAPRAERENDPLTETTVGSEMIYQNHFIKVLKESVTLPGGESSTRFVFPHRGACAMIPLDKEGNIVLERQWRHPLRRSFWEIPAGKIDPSEDELDCAKRELLEECGITAKTWKRLGLINNAIGYSNEHIVIYLAEDLTYGEQELDPGEYLELYRVPLKEAVAMCRDGRVTDVKTLVGIFWLEKELADRQAK